MQLTKNFSLEEFEQSETATSLGIDNTVPSEEIVFNLTQLCENVLQPLRDKVGSALTVTSGYRCKELNDAVGGVSTSQHLIGMASDVKSKLSSYRLAKTAYDNEVIWNEIDQMILYPSFVHFSHRVDGDQRQQVLYSSTYTGKKIK